jgi:NTP pyrophosphatase (non-canonical NTP hydrolase)
MNKLSEEIYLANKEKGFWDKERNVGEMLMLITSELGEAMEAHRKNRFAIRSEINPQKDIEPVKFEHLIKDTFEDEIADAIIRLLDMCGGLKIDIEWHIIQKLRYNATRPRLHGKQY